MNDIRRILPVYVLFSILVGCSAKPFHYEKQDTDRQYVGSTKNVNQTESQKVSHKNLEPSAPSAKEKGISTPSLQKKVILDVPLISQNPELKYGCEVTSLAMVLQYAGIKVDKTELANRIKKENDPPIVGKGGDILHWGDPKDGFVGDMTGKNKGYAVYVQPLQELMEQYLPNRTVNLTGKSFDEVLSQINKGKPVVVWTTGNYNVPKRWESWQHGTKQINATLDLHAVVLVGFEPGYIYVNDPLTVKKGNKVNRSTFIHSWNALGQQALSYR